MSVVVEFKDVNKKIGKKQVIDNFNLTVKEGEVFGLLGPNGAGKTTLLKLLLGLLKIDSGDILVDGTSSIKNYQKNIIKIGALIEMPVYYPYLTGFDNLKIFSLMNKSKTDIKEIIKIIGLQDQIDKKVSAYSLGMKQRLGLGIALLRKPKILLLDEPTNGLDPTGIAELRNYLRCFAQEENVTVIVSSHILSEMNLLCDRFAIMSQGRMITTILKEDFLKQNETQEYSVQIDNILQAYALLSEKYSVKINEQRLICSVLKEEIADIITILVESGLKIYAVQPQGNPLEKIYFEAIKTKEV